jgi:hypothetical protein
MDVLQRDAWDAGPRELGDHFRLEKNRNLARCAIWTHPLGWELRLLINEDLRQSQVCRSQTEVFDTAESWKAAYVAKGWGPARVLKQARGPAAQIVKRRAATPAIEGA